MKTTHPFLLISLVALLLTVTVRAQSENEFLGTSAGDSNSSGSYNVFLGDFSGYRNTSGGWNTYVGSRAGGSYTYTEWMDWINNGTPLPDIGGTNFTGSSNVFVGANTGLRNRSGNQNTFVGARAGLWNSTGYSNTFIGTETGVFNTIGRQNTFVGEAAGRSNTTGSENVFIGEDAAYNNVDGYQNVAVGSLSLYNNTSGWANTAAGKESGFSNRTGVKNTFYGWVAGRFNSDGILNTMIGSNAGIRTRYSDYNTFLGAYAGGSNNILQSKISANRNTAVGVLAGSVNRQGEDNVMIGAFADSSDFSTVHSGNLRADLTSNDHIDQGPSGNSADNEVYRIVNIGSYGFVKGDDAVGVGYKNRSHGTGSVALGSRASSTHTQAIAIGYQAASHGDNIAVIGNSSTASIDPGADGVTALGSSTYRYANVHAETYQVAADATSPAVINFAADAGTDNNDHWRVQAADSGNFTIATYATGAYVDVLAAQSDGNVTVAGDLVVNSDARLKQNVAPIDNALDLLEQLRGCTYEWKPETGRSEGTHYGLIAQEVEEVIPELVHDNGEGGIKSVNYQGFVPILINAVGEISKQNDLQQQEIADLRKQFEENQELLKQLTANNETFTTASK